MRDTVAQHGRLDLMFNNAGISITGDARDLSIAQWRRVIDINLMGVIYGSDAAYKAMAAQGSGQIAVTVNQPTTHRTIQLKGHDARVHSIDASCIGEIAAQTSAFVEEIIAIGEPSEDMVRAYVQFELHDVIAISFTLHEVFVSTPGPTAGARLS